MIAGSIIIGCMGPTTEENALYWVGYNVLTGWGWRQTSSAVQGLWSLTPNEIELVSEGEGIHEFIYRSCYEKVTLEDKALRLVLLGQPSFGVPLLRRGVEGLIISKLVGFN